MTAATRIALLGNHSPRRCGIATFTDDLAESLANDPTAPEVLVVAMNDGRDYAYPPVVQLSVAQDDLAAYEATADALNARNIDVLCVQHEFGIFGGPAGSFLLTLLRRVRAPVVTTLHTVLESFTPEQWAVIEELSALSARLVVMSERAVRLLVAQGIPRDKIAFIHHGVHVSATDRAVAKADLGLTGRTLVMTFGLLSPNKGIETAIRALPAVVAAVPDLTYLVLGETHPHIRARHGEAYRDSLKALAAELGVADHLRFDDRFVDNEELIHDLAAADVYLVPYLTREQITSGTLAYALGNGRAVVSTPFWHAEELLADGRGMLVPFQDPQAIAGALLSLLAEPGRRQALEQRARQFGERMRWPAVAGEYVALFGSLRVVTALPQQPLRLPAARLDHVAALVDDTGMFQHALHALPNLSEGYTVDDNARALHLAALLPERPEAARIAGRALSFLHHGLNPATGRFRNFMGYDRRWLDEDGGDNTQARCLRALVAAAGGGGGIGRAAAEVLNRAWPAIGALESPRAQAIALMALSEHALQSGHELQRAVLARRYAANLLRLHAAVATPAWPWFETTLSYSNAKLPHGLIAFGRAFGDATALATGLSTLRWLEQQQTAPDGGFLPVGSERCYAAGEARPLWDGQPIEVYATVSAVLEAHRATGDASWLAAARRALEWLLGRNPLKLSLYDASTGGCRDGLHRDRLNANQGAESTLALWLGVAEYEAASVAALLPSGPVMPPRAVAAPAGD